MTTWIFLRGLMREARHWGEFPTQFRAAMPGQDIVTIDFPGNGSLHEEKSATTVEQMAEHCRNYLKQSGHLPPYHVVALSLGAMVAVAWADRHPADIKKMVLINTSLAPHNPFYQRLRPQNYLTLCSLLMHGSVAHREALIWQLTSSKTSDEQRKNTVAQWRIYATECPINRMNIVRQLRAAMFYRAPKGIPAASILLLAGRQDKLVNPACSLTLAQKWACPIKIHPSAGHDLPLDDGEWVAQQIKAWL